MKDPPSRGEITISESKGKRVGGKKTRGQKNQARGEIYRTLPDGSGEVPHREKV